MNFKITTLIILGTIISYFSLEGQDVFCGVCESHRSIEEKEISYAPLVRSFGGNCADTTELIISFSHTKVLEDEIGSDSLGRAYKRLIDSLNVCFWNSGIRIKAKYFEGENIVIDADRDSMANVLADIQGSVGPYQIINEHKLCNNIHFNVHIVDGYPGSNGIASVGSLAAKNINFLHTVCRWLDVDWGMVGLIRHEIGHLLGMGHDDDHWTVGAFDYSRGYSDSTNFKISIMWWTLIQPQFASFRFSHDSIAPSGLKLGDVNHDNVNTANLVSPTYQLYYNTNRKIDLEGITEVCIGDNVPLKMNIERLDETPWVGLYEWEGLFLSSNDQQEVIFEPQESGEYTILCKTLDQTFNNCVWQETEITISVLEDEILMEEVEVCEGEVYELPNGDLIAEAGTYEFVVEDTAANGCDQMFSVEVSLLENETRDTLIELMPGSAIELVDGTIVNVGGSYTALELGASDNGCDIWWTYNIIESTSVNDVKKSINIYPNPAMSVINVETNMQYDEIWITDIHGITILTRSRSDKLLVESLSPGIYLVSVIMDNSIALRQRLMIID